MDWIEFILGGLLVNAMAHIIIGLTKTRYLSLFGYSPLANISYALLQIIIVILLVWMNYKDNSFFEHGFVLGGLLVLILFLIFGRFSLRFFKQKE